MERLFNKRIAKVLAGLFIANVLLTSCIPNFDFLYPDQNKQLDGKENAYSFDNEVDVIKVTPSQIINGIEFEESNTTDKYLTKKIYMDMDWKYATYSVINEGYTVLYTVNPYYESIERKNKVVAINAGHGTKGGQYVKTVAHPDFSPRVAGGTNKVGDTMSLAVSVGTTLQNGVTEAEVNLYIAIALRDRLIDDGYDVLMIREDDDCRLDNVARTVMANENADMHIAIHFDSTDYDKGVFIIIPYSDGAYQNMEPLRSNIKNIFDFTDAMLKGFRDNEMKIWKNKGTLQGDLTQISYSTIPSIDLELGDRATVIDEYNIVNFVKCIEAGIDNYFNK